MRQKPVGRKVSKQEEISKRLSLPADLRLPENFVSRQTVSPTLEGPLTRYLIYLKFEILITGFMYEIWGSSLSKHLT